MREIAYRIEKSKGKILQKLCVFNILVRQKNVRRTMSREYLSWLVYRSDPNGTQCLYSHISYSVCDNEYPHNNLYLYNLSTSVALYK